MKEVKLKNENVRSQGSTNFHFKICLLSNLLVSRRTSVVAFSILVLLEISQNFLP